jgi:hypothetical protein
MLSILEKKVILFKFKQQGLIVAITSNMGSVDAQKLSLMGNLACGLTETQLSTISTIDFT